MMYSNDQEALAVFSSKVKRAYLIGKIGEASEASRKFTEALQM
jgi:hypothetical protein